MANPRLRLECDILRDPRARGHKACKRLVLIFYPWLNSPMGGRLNLLTGKWAEDKPKRKSPEAAVGRAVDDFLRIKGAYIRTIKSDGTKTRDGWRRSAQGAGISDRIGILPGGRFVAVELKAPGRKSTLSQPQYTFLSEILVRGGLACVADSVNCVALAFSQSSEDMRVTLDRYKPKD